MSKIHSKKNYIVILLMTCILLLSTAFAFLTAKDETVNTFTVGNISISLTEPQWDATNPSGAFENILPGQTITKDPTITVNENSNSAYVYMMLEVPKVYKVDIVNNDVTESKDQHQLFEYAVNEGWILIDSKTNDNTEAYNYYVYAYNNSLAANESAQLFDNVTFANVTSDFVENIGNGLHGDLNIKVTGYAIQSDFYNNEATDAASAWSLYVNQNSWKWPVNKYEGIVTLTYVDENGEILYSEKTYKGDPINLFYTTEYAQTGKFFEWVNYGTDETVYNGIRLENDTTVVATYTDTGFGNTTFDYGVYLLEENNGNYSVSLVGVDVTNSNYPTNGNNSQDLIIPVSLTFNMPSTNGADPNSLYGMWVDGGCLLYPGDTLLSSGQHTLYVENIAESAMHNYYTLTNNTVTSVDAYYDNVVIPDSVKTIGKNAFAGVGTDGGVVSINNVYMSYGVERIEEGAFCNGYTIQSIKMPTSLEYIGEGAFASCVSLTSLNVSNGVYEIDNYAFDGCIALTEFKIPENVTKISDEMFMGSGIQSINIPDNVKEIGKQAFSGCDSLSEVTIPASVEIIGEYAFRDAWNLKAITVAADNASYSSDNNGALYDKDKTTLIQYPPACEETTFNMPETTTQINPYAFYYALVQNVTIPNGVDFIGNNAFRNCTDLKTVSYVGNKLVTVEEATFSGCTSLTNFVVSEGVTEIKASAFYGCSKLEKITIPETVTKIGFGAFNKCTSLNSVEYSGIENDWNNISIAANNKPIINASKIYK